MKKLEKYFPNLLEAIDVSAPRYLQKTPVFIFANTRTSERHCSRNDVTRLS